MAELKKFNELNHSEQTKIMNALISNCWKTKILSAEHFNTFGKKIIETKDEFLVFGNIYVKITDIYYYKKTNE